MVDKEPTLREKIEEIFFEDLIKRKMEKAKKWSNPDLYPDEQPTNMDIIQEMSGEDVDGLSTISPERKEMAKNITGRVLLDRYKQQHGMLPDYSMNNAMTKDSNLDTSIFGDGFKGFGFENRMDSWRDAPGIQIASASNVPMVREYGYREPIQNSFADRLNQRLGMAASLSGGLPMWYTILAAGTNLNEKKKEMDTTKFSGGDNFYHRLAMCENAQKGYGPVSFYLGLGKEVYDILKKTAKGNNTFSVNLKDSKKDMENNIEGLIWGLQNPSGDCRIWLKDLDMKTNTWRK